LLVISCGLNIYTYYRYKELQSENRDLVLQRDRLFVDNGSMQARMQDLDSGLRAINSPGVIRISLKGVAGKEGSEAIVYWSKSTTDVYISLLHLPQAPAGKQYQLWALLDGKPIDAGVLGNCVSICRQKNISNAQAFAITLEKEGGSQSPTLSQLYVMGKI
jgi:hypothetical protein